MKARAGSSIKPWWGTVDVSWWRDTKDHVELPPLQHLIELCGATVELLGPSALWLVGWLVQHPAAWLRLLAYAVHPVSNVPLISLLPKQLYWPFFKVAIKCFLCHPNSSKTIKKGSSMHIMHESQTIVQQTVSENKLDLWFRRSPPARLTRCLF